MSDQPHTAPMPDLQVGQEPSSVQMTHCYRNALKRLGRSFAQKRPLAILIGAGKSASQLVIQSFLSSLDENVAIARITEPCADATELMRKIIRAAGFQPKDMNLVDLESIFTLFLGFQKEHDRRTIICLEQAHDSEWWVLDKIRRLVETEVDEKYGLLVIICGESKLTELLKTRPLRDICAHAGYRISLEPFTMAESLECIRQRVEAAGTASVGQLVHYQAITLIHELCAGVPDAIDTLVDHCFDLAKQEGVDFVTTGIVERAYEASRAVPRHESDDDATTVEISQLKAPIGHLIVQITADDIRAQALRQGHTLIGRSKLCDVRVDSPVVSRHHALINYSLEGATLVDLGSTNGTFVDGYQIQQHELVPGETIAVGNCKIEYVIDDEVQASRQDLLPSENIEIPSTDR